MTDNQGAARIVSVGSSKVHLQSDAMSIFDFCFSKGITLEAQWIPRSQNERAISLADSLTKTIDASILQFCVSLMLNGVLIHSTALKPITVLSSPARSLPLPDAVGSTPCHRTGAPKTTGSVPQLVSSSILSAILCLALTTGH